MKASVYDHDKGFLLYIIEHIQDIEINIENNAM